MIAKKPIDANELLETAKKSPDKESYKVLHKTPIYRIGVGARITRLDASFFIEVIVNLSDESKNVNLAKLETVLILLKILKTRQYSLVYEDDNCIQCETTRANQDLNGEYFSLKTLLNTQLG